MEPEREDWVAKLLPFVFPLCLGQVWFTWDTFVPEGPLVVRWGETPMPSERLGPKPLWFLATALVCAIAIEIWRRSRAKRSGEQLEPLRRRWPAILLLSWFTATLLLFVVAFPLIDLIGLLSTGRLSWSKAGIILGLPVVIVAMLFALRREKWTGCITLILALTLCPVVLIIFGLGTQLWKALSSLKGVEIGPGEIALLLAAIVACAVLLYVGAKRAGKPGPPRSDGDE